MKQGKLPAIGFEYFTVCSTLCGKEIRKAGICVNNIRQGCKTQFRWEKIGPINFVTLTRRVVGEQARMGK